MLHARKAARVCTVDCRQGDNPGARQGAALRDGRGCPGPRILRFRRNSARGAVVGSVAAVARKVASARWGRPAAERVPDPGRMARKEWHSGLGARPAVRGALSRGVAEGVPQCARSSTRGVLGRSVEVTGHTGKEQIDLLLWIGSTIVVGEL